VTRNTPLNPQADQMADESMVRTLDAQARAIWPQEVQLIDRYELPPNPRILDVGSGTGEGASRLADHFPHSPVLGVDVIEENLARARARLAGLAPRLSFELRSAYGLGLPAESFDLTVCRQTWLGRAPDWPASLPDSRSSCAAPTDSGCRRNLST
jgi:ubiquinone/menaquinone biosynthesis C-methylase UbiE